MPFDKRSETNLATLVPRARKQARRFLQAVLDADLNVRIIGGSRTFAAQDALYAQGRSKPGLIVTNARGGFSKHNFGIAWDIGVFDDKGKYLPDSPDYAKAGAIGRKVGVEWGGDWKGIVDRPHFQCPSPLPIARMREIVLANGGDISEPKAMAAVNALLPDDDDNDSDDDAKAPVKKPISAPAPTPTPAPTGTPTDDWLPIEVYLNTKKFDITAYFKDSRAWVSLDDFADYFGGTVVKKASTPTKATLQIEGDSVALAGVLVKKRLIVKFADVNALFGYPFRFDSAAKRLTLSK
jgi:peptidoglycan L-alanyl-D-glutamate endopeptidase CwlK